MSDLPVHPVAAVFPMLPDAELDRLGADIKANGLRHRIVLWRDNTAGPDQGPLYLIDGRNRLAAMKRAGVKIPTVEDGLRAAPGRPATFEVVEAVHWTMSLGTSEWTASDGTNPVALVIGLNVHRRHLTKAQQAALIHKAVKAGASDLAKLARSEMRTFPGGTKGGSTPDPVKAATVAQAAEHGISKRTVERAVAELAEPEPAPVPKPKRKPPKPPKPANPNRDLAVKRLTKTAKTQHADRMAELAALAPGEATATALAGLVDVLADQLSEVQNQTQRLGASQRKASNP